MSAHPPPVPPDQRPQHGGDTSHAEVDAKPQAGTPNGNLGEQGQAGNTKQNTTNKGLQQDR